MLSPSAVPISPRTAQHTILHGLIINHHHICLLLIIRRCWWWFVMNSLHNTGPLTLDIPGLLSHQYGCWISRPTWLVALSLMMCFKTFTMGRTLRCSQSSSTCDVSMLAAAEVHVWWSFGSHDERLGKGNHTFIWGIPILRLYTPVWWFEWEQCHDSLWRNSIAVHGRGL